MNNIDFYTPNKEYRIILTKQPRYFGYSEYGQYLCSITFYNSIGLEVLKINTNEKEILKAISSLYEFELNYGGCMISDIIYFDNNQNENYFVTIDAIFQDYPVEEELVVLCVYLSTIQGNRLKLSVNINLYELNELIYKLYSLIEDIPYLPSMMEDDMEEFIRGYSN